MRLRSTLEQWNTLRAVDECGSIQAAAAQLNKSHTTLIYALKKLEAQLAIQLVEVVGRKAELTADGKTLLRYANSMLEQAQNLEVISAQLSKDIESEITVAIDHLCDKQILYRALQKFAHQNSMTSVQMIETSLTSTIETVTQQRADVAIINLPVTDFPAEALSMVTMIPVVAKGHILATKADLTMAEVAQETQIVLRDLGNPQFSTKTEDKNVGWLKAKRRITVDNFDFALQAVRAGLGFTRIPEYLFQREGADDLVQLDIQGANYYQVPIHITLPKGLATGPAARSLYALILEEKAVNTE